MSDETIVDRIEVFLFNGNKEVFLNTLTKDLHLTYDWIQIGPRTFMTDDVAFMELDGGYRIYPPEKRGWLPPV